MNPEITKIIEQYLAGELSSADKKAFEERLANNEELQQEVELQRSIHEAAKRAAVRTQVKDVAKNYKFSKKLKWGGLGLGILAVVAVSSMYLTNSQSRNSDFSLDEVEQLTEKLEEQSSIDNLKSEFFAWNANDTAFLSKEGVLVSVPENAFLLNGQPYKESAVIQWQEALDGATIVKSGLSTTSDGKLLETQGMFSFSAKTKTGEQLTINPKVGVYVQVPVDEYKDGMMLFDGVKDSKGMINWVKPREMEKIPIPVSMKDLDFYPTEYEPQLNELKARKDKKYRDSLYLSFEEDFKAKVEKPINEIPESISIDQVISEFIYQEPSFPGGYLEMNNFISLNTIYPSDALDANIDGKVFLSFIVSETGAITNVRIERSLYPSLDAEAMRIVQSMPDWIPAQNFRGENVSSQQRLPITFAIDNNKIKKREDVKNSNKSKPSADSVSSAQGVGSSTESYIPPSSVLAFWKPKFNNTILATREFEARMREIHKMCDKSVLDIYVKNLKKPMYELDKRVAAKGYSQFNDFADQKIGALNRNNPHLEALTDFYDAAVKQLKNQEKTLRTQEENRRNNWDKGVSTERQKETARTANREANVFIEEYNLNHKNVRRQLGRVLGATIYGDNPISNIDKFVMETTLARKTGEFYDEVTGRTARIQYNKFAFTVSNHEDYKQLYAYLFPDQLNSYHRLDQKNGKFSFPLNEAIIYDLVIVGISEDGYSYTQRTKLKGGELGELRLDNISEKNLDSRIRKLNANRGVKPFDVKEELRWLKKEQHNYVEQKRRNDNKEFRDQLRPYVFPCAFGESGNNTDQYGGGSTENHPTF